MSEVEVKESGDQPDKGVEEDQPGTETEEGEPTEEVVEGDQPEEGVEEEEDYIEVDGELLTVDELKNGYLRQKDYTQKTQGLSEQQKQVAKMLESMNKPMEPQVSPEQQEVLNKLKGYGVPTTDEVKQLIQQAVATQNIVSQRDTIKKKYSLDDAMMSAVYSYSVTAGVSMEEAAKKFAGEKKVIKKKGLSVKGGKPSGSKKTDGVDTVKGAKTRLTELSKKPKLTDKEKKEFDTIRTKWEKGELQQ